MHHIGISVIPVGNVTVLQLVAGALSPLADMIITLNHMNLTACSIIKIHIAFVFVSQDIHAKTIYRRTVYTCGAHLLRQVSFIHNWGCKENVPSFGTCSLHRYDGLQIVLSIWFVSVTTKVAFGPTHGVGTHSSSQ